jgi:branched-chain amino acid transport system substrate-binding protein
MGAAAVGAIVGDTWTPGQASEESRRFVEAFRKKYKRLPSAYAAFSYDAAMLLDAALRSVKGNAGDRKAFSKAIASAQFKSVRGPFRFGPNNFPVQNYHIYQVANAGGKPEFKLQEADVLKSHADAYVSQCASR